jgi:hypothetical protein
MMLTREQIAEARDFRLEVVEVPAWSGAVGVRSMTIRDRDEMHIHYMQHSGDLSALVDAAQPLLARASSLSPEILRDMKVRLLSYCLCDETGALLCNDEAGRDMLRQKSGEVLDQLYDVAMRLNKMSEESFEQEKKGSETIRFNGSS